MDESHLRNRRSFEKKDKLMTIIAHRSGTDKFQEQTIASAKNSITLGADLIEIDIRFTLDFVPVVCHDSDAQRLYGDTRHIDEMTALEFLALRRVADKSVCGHLFRDYLDCGIENMLFHIKEGGEKNLSLILSMCQEFGITDKIVFGVSKVEDCRYLKSLGMKVLAFMPSAEKIKEFADAGADYIRLWEKWCTDENVAAVKSTGKSLWVMTDSPSVGEVTEDTYELCRRIKPEGVLLNKICLAKNFK